MGGKNAALTTEQQAAQNVTASEYLPLDTGKWQMYNGSRKDKGVFCVLTKGAFVFMQIAGEIL